ncbi:MAG: 2,3-diphosphoglycerate-dependent phosphoglycerate mutase [Sphingomonadaceae bacterium]|uniref:2,3-diphosphoglycerate-dependent phosphoglycerate mutase n=1 Tax=Thermaurantiacus sp. TaxID=2820283 RepID=UPI00298F2FBD|nr:2,3-diphosphoglycerate-dependent phosphoglycerate mutase [Thermaurantiacus sp.]MCS6985971.1 2,3-diphosphoglycerate-dependent phosphoglycerate mutase [Sphingomonadaceae bacterium]MDW8414813.1 2,3-diphosphoglycerate-dependent phosphoglycerate mutase [Thermaurantiacus sp.]
MPLLVLVRHGQSLWNLENRFTGWWDVDLSPAGVLEAEAAGRRLAAAGFDFDLVFTSVLVRAIKTCHLLLEAMGRLWLPVVKDWRLNERHYGGLTGLDKHETAAAHGAAQVQAWRRSYDVPPPPMPDGHPFDVRGDRRYAGLEVPRGESLKDTIARALPCWEERLAPALRQGRRVLVVAHGNSLRGLVKHLSAIPDADIPAFEIPTAVPLVYELDSALVPVDRRFLEAA